MIIAVTSSPGMTYFCSLSKQTLYIREYRLQKINKSCYIIIEHDFIENVCISFQQSFLHINLYWTPALASIFSCDNLNFVCFNTF